MTLRLYTQDELTVIGVSWMMRELLFYPFDLFSYKNMDFGGVISVLSLPGGETLRKVARDPLFGVQVTWRTSPHPLRLDPDDVAPSELPSADKEWHTEILFNLDGTSAGANPIGRWGAASYLTHGIAHSEVGVGVKPDDELIYPGARKSMPVANVGAALSMSGYWKRMHTGMLGKAGGMYGWSVDLWKQEGLAF